MEDYRKDECRCPKIGMKAPDFTALTTVGTIKLSDYRGKWVVLFSHPADFTPVCTTEFIAFAKSFPYFQKRNVQLLGLSIDSNTSHLAWINNIYQHTGVQIPFPLIADKDGTIAKQYGMLSPEVSTTETVRTVFIIDENQIIRAMLIYPMTNGRNIPEILRLVDALQTSDREKVATPANWMPGLPVVLPPPQTYEDLLERQMHHPELHCMDWYLCYKRIKD
ncbi:MAG: peroxiredoxin [Bacillota bacterium]